MIDLVIYEWDTFLNVLEMVVILIVLSDESRTDVLLLFELSLPHHTTIRSGPILWIPPYHIPLLWPLLRLFQHMIPLSQWPLLTITSYWLQIYRLILWRFRFDNSFYIQIRSILQLHLYLSKQIRENHPLTAFSINLLLQPVQVSYLLIILL